MRNKCLKEETWVVNLEDILSYKKFDLFFKSRTTIPFIFFLYKRKKENLTFMKNYRHKLLKTDFVDNFIFKSKSINKFNLYCIETQKNYEI
jgi:hypothetical protein